jgi:type IV pilus assembly protein PilY1
MPVAQPITTAIEFSKINGTRVLYIGTGRLLKDSDGASTQTQTVYALKDKVYAQTPRLTSTVIQQQLTQSTSTTRNIVQPQQVMDWTVKDGWFVDFLSGGERVAVDMSINGSTLSVASSAPNTDPCLGGGVAWLYNFDFKTGGKPSTMSVTSSVGNYLGRALATKPTVVKLPSGTLIAIVRLTDNTVVTSSLPSSALVTGRRVGWRLLLN